MCLALCSACGNAEQTAPSSNANASNNAAASNTVPADNGTPAAATDNEEDEAEINIALMSLAPIDQAASAAVVDAVNAYTEKDINVHVNIKWYDAATYGTQVPMSIQANEPLDIIMFTPVPGTSYTSYRSANQLMDLRELLEEYGQTILEIEGDLLKGTSYGDAIYGITHYSSKTGFAKVIVRKDLADAAGVTEDLLAAKSWSEIRAAFEKITAETGMPALVNSDAQGNVMYPRPFMPNGDLFSDAFWYDNLGDGYQLIFVDPATDTIQSFFDSDYFTDMCQRVSDWYKAGLVYKDAATAQEYGDTLVKAGIGYAQIRATELGIIESSEAITGYELLGVDITQSKIGTNSCTKFGYAIPVTSREPEAAMRYLNYIYENGAVLDLLTWGIEGRDWVLNDKGEATYPEGVTADTVPYHTADFLYGDQMLITPWEGSPENLREKQQIEMDNAEVSKYMGFTLNTDGLENLITACNNVRLQYDATLNSGSSPDWEGTLASFRKDLADAGIQDLITAYQAQLDQWLADNG